MITKLSFKKPITNQHSAPNLIRIILVSHNNLAIAFKFYQPLHLTPKPLKLNKLTHIIAQPN